MTKQQMIDNYYARKLAIENLTKGNPDENELDLETLGNKIKQEILPGIHGNKVVSLVPRASYASLNYKKVKASVSPSIWEKLEAFVTYSKESVSLTISLLVQKEEIKDYPKSGFKLAAEKINEAEERMMKDRGAK